MQKLLFVSRQIGNSGGAEKRMMELSEALQDTYIIETYPILGVLDIYFAKKTPIKRAISFVQRFLKITRFIKKYKPDLIHCFDLESGIYVRIAIFFLQSNSVFVSGYGGEKIESKSVKKLLSYSFFWPSLFVCNSTNGAQALKSVTKDKVPVKIIYNGIKESVIDSQLPDWANMGRTVVGYVGKFDHNKRADRIFEVAKDFVDHPSNPIFVIIGTGANFKEYEEVYQSDPELKKMVVLTNIIPQVHKVIPYFSIGLLCSDSEGFPTVTLEYMSSKVPVISTLSGEVSHIIDDGKAGILIPKYTKEAFSSAVKLLLEDNALRLQYAQKGYDRYSSLFTFKKMVTEFLSTYNEYLRR